MCCRHSGPLIVEPFWRFLLPDWLRRMTCPNKNWGKTDPTSQENQTIRYRAERAALRRAQSDMPTVELIPVGDGMPGPSPEIIIETYEDDMVDRSDDARQDARQNAIVIKNLVNTGRLWLKANPTASVQDYRLRQHWAAVVKNFDTAQCAMAMTALGAEFVDRLPTAVKRIG